MSKVVGFGEVMARLSPPGFLRLAQCLPGSLDVTYGGAEANVAVTVAALGGQSRFVTALPKNPLADACVANLRSFGVDTASILRTGTGRLGLYFIEGGANQRPSNVVYDRDGSSISQTPADAYDWTGAFDGAAWFHTTGITPSLSRAAADATLASVKAAKAAGLTVSCDLNFRKKLWNWESGTKPRNLAEKTMRQVLPHVDVLIANEEDAESVLGIHAAGTDVHSGRLAADRYPDVARQIVKQFPNIATVAITLRESVSASHNNWGAMLYEAAAGAAHFAPLRDGAYRPYEIRDIVDRVGAGDAFGGALIFAMLTPELAAPAEAVAFAAAASCLAHSIVGDFNFTTRAEVEALMHGSGSGRVVR
jgi:2-dehydro-3-deoxygluconokinase